MPGSDSTVLVRKIALDAKLVTDEQVQKAIAHRTRTNSRLPLAEILLQLGFIDGSQFKSLMTLQQTARKGSEEMEESRLFGKLVLTRGLATPEQVEKCLREQARLADIGDYKNLGEIMVGDGVVTSSQVKNLLEERNQVIMFCAKCSTRFNVLKEWASRSRCPECGDTLAMEKSAAVGVVATLGTQKADVGDLIGKTIGGCRMLQVLGRGSMGAVYKARHIGLNRFVAVKVMPAVSRDPQTVQRLLFEARAIAKLEHPNIVQVYDVGFHQNLFFIVMQLLVGQTLKERYEEMGALPGDEFVQVVRDIARGLGAAHEKGIVHRDLKMENIIITEDGRSRITDFGLASDTGTKDQLEGFIVGTPLYMSPEQWLGHKADERSDLYALGAILYTISSGTRPFEGDNLQALMQQHLKVVPKPAKEHNSMLSDEFCAVVRKLLAKSPQRRYQNVTEFLRDLERYTRGETPEAMEHFGRMIRCGFCETVNPASEKKCKVCHEPLRSVASEVSLQTRTDEFKCHGCGAINRKGARACSGCAKGFCSNCKRRLAVLQGFCERCMDRARQA